MVFNPEGFTEKSPMSTGPSVNFKKPSARKSLRQFYEVFDAKQRTAVRRLSAAKSKLKAIISGIML